MLFRAVFPTVKRIKAHASCVFEKKRVSDYTPLRGKQKYQVTNVGVIEFKMTETQRKTTPQQNGINFKAVLTNGNCKLFLGLEQKYKRETITMLRLSLVKFLSAHILQGGKV